MSIPKTRPGHRCDCEFCEVSREDIPLTPEEIRWEEERLGGEMARAVAREIDAWTPPRSKRERAIRELALTARIDIGRAERMFVGYRAGP